MATTTTALSLDKTLMAQINERADELKLSPSRLLSLAVKEYLENHARLGEERKARRLREISQAWIHGLDAEERAVLRGMRKKYRAVVARDPW